MNTVRFAINDVQHQYDGQEWDAAFHHLQEKIEVRELPLTEATEHGWHDKYEYAIYNGATDEMLPSLLEIGKEMGCRVQYPFVEDRNWHNPQ